MSAILGRIEFSGRPIVESRFRIAMDHCAHYGPDSSGLLINGPVALGQFHLSVARQRKLEGLPYQLGPHTIIADAIIDNRDEIIASLAIDRIVANTLPDSALILSAYGKWGNDCLRYIAGDFAFAIWDASKRRLFLARDHIGSRPLFWRREGDCFVFGTEIGSLVSMSDLDWKIEFEAVTDFLSHPMDPLGRGFFRGLETCQPGSHTTIDANSIKNERWWDPSNAKPEWFRTEAQYAERLRELVDRSILTCTDTDLEVGSHISGGIDSTAVAVLAHRALMKRGRGLAMSFSWTPPVSSDYPDIGQRDERRRINEIASREGFETRWAGTNSESLVDLIRRPLEFDGIADLATELTVLKQAAADGVGVMLSGWGGDEGFSAPGHYGPAKLLAQGRLITLWRLLQATRSQESLRGSLRLLWREALQPQIPDWAPRSARSRLVHMNASRFFRKELGLEAKPRPTKLRVPSNPNGYLRALILHGHLASRMETWARWAAPSKMVYRYPLLGRDILEFMSSLPPEMYMKDGLPRCLARLAIHDLNLGKVGKFDPVNEISRKRARKDFLTKSKQLNLSFSGARLMDWAAIEELAEHSVGAYGRRSDLGSHELLLAMRAAEVLAKDPATCHKLTDNISE